MNVEPDWKLVTKQINGDAIENDRNDADRGSPEHDAGFAARVDRGFLAHRIKKKRHDGEQEERIDNCQTKIIGSAITERSEERVWPVENSSRETRQRLTEPEEERKPFQPGSAAIDGRALREDGKESIEESAKHTAETGRERHERRRPRTEDRF